MNLNINSKNKVAGVRLWYKLDFAWTWQRGRLTINLDGIRHELTFNSPMTWPKYLSQSFMNSPIGPY